MNKDRDAKFLTIKEEYDKFYKTFYDRGTFPHKNFLDSFWSTTPMDDIYAFFQKVELSKYSNFLDMGSGDGVVVAIAFLFTKAAGIEKHEELYRTSKEFFAKLKIDAKLINDDFQNINISKYDFVYINPDKSFTLKFENKLLNELRGKLYVYNTVFRANLVKKVRAYRAGMTYICVFDKKGITQKS